MTVLLDRHAAQHELTRRYPAPYLTLLYTLRRRRSIPPDLFYGYWRDTHCQVSARLPGQHSPWIHFLDFERGGLWPAVPGIGRELAEADRFDGVPEPVYTGAEGVAQFAAAMKPLEDDEVNIFEETIGYRALGANSRTFVDRLAEPAPVLDQGVLRFLVFCKQSATVDGEMFRAFIREELAPRWAESDEVLKLRLHLLEPYATEGLLMESGGVNHAKEPDKQYQACFEIVFADAVAMRRFATSTAWLAAGQRAHLREQHAFLVTRHYCMRHLGELTLTGRRTAAVAEQILRVGAVNQLTPQVSALIDGRSRPEQR